MKERRKGRIRTNRKDGNERIRQWMKEQKTNIYGKKLKKKKATKKWMDRKSRRQERKEKPRFENRAERVETSLRHQNRGSKVEIEEWCWLLCQ